jgi:hypothetical protein
MIGRGNARRPVRWMPQVCPLENGGLFSVGGQPTIAEALADRAFVRELH